MINREKTGKEAKEIMDSFMKALGRVKESQKDFGAEREQGRRTPEKKKENDFKKRMLKNAPKKDDDYILAEKKSW